MPIGVITNVLSVVIGGILGSLLGNSLSDRFKENMNLIFGICAMTMGISSIVQMENMPAVVFSVILGTAVGMALHLGDGITAAGGRIQQGISRFVKSPSGLSAEEFQASLLTVIVLFCASGTGIYGSIVEGMSGDASILISKSILDLFTAMIFACSLGIVVSVIAVPQFVIFFILYLLGGVIYPYTTPAMIGDFKAVGGALLLATGFRMSRIKMFPTADMIPAMILAMPLSAFWTGVVMPLLG